MDGRSLKSSGALAYAVGPASRAPYFRIVLPPAYLAFVWGALMTVILASAY